jgi:hypothetical protein
LLDDGAHLFEKQSCRLGGEVEVFALPRLEKASDLALYLVTVCVAAAADLCPRGRLRRSFSGLPFGFMSQRRAPLVGGRGFARVSDGHILLYFIAKANYDFAYK